MGAADVRSNRPHDFFGWLAALDPANAGADGGLSGGVRCFVLTHRSASFALVSAPVSGLDLAEESLCDLVKACIRVEGLQAAFRMHHEGQKDLSSPSEHGAHQLHQCLTILTSALGSVPASHERDFEVSPTYAPGG